MARWRWASALAVAALVTGPGLSPAQAAARHKANGGLAFLVAVAHIATALPDGSGPVQVSSGPNKDLDPAYSSNGSRIAFEGRRTGSGDIYVMNADGSGVLRLTTDPREDGQPAWSPDGNRIAFSRCGSTNCSIWIMTSAGANQHRITRSRGIGDLETDPAWSPGGHLIAFRAIVPGGVCNQIWVMHPDGADRRALTSCRGKDMGGTQDFGPTFSPDGTRIAYEHSYAATPRLTIDRIVVMRRDGSGKHAITPLAMSAGDPAWSPDGSEIAFTRARPLSVDTMIMRPDGRDRILVAAHTRRPTWRPAACTITGTSGPDVLAGTPGNDVICGLGGRDMITGRGGTDIISGGRGAHDSVWFLWATAGVRVRVGLHAIGRGTEFLSGIEDVHGSRFDDVIRAGGAPNRIWGRAGADIIRGGLDRDRLLGGRGGDRIDARDGQPGDVVDGGRGADLCRADVGDLVRRC